MLHLIKEMQMRTDFPGTVITLSASEAVEQLELPSTAAEEGGALLGTSPPENRLAAPAQLHVCTPDDAHLPPWVCSVEKLRHVCTKRHAIRVSIDLFCPVWLRWVDVIPQSKRSLVRFLIRAHAWVAGLVPGWGVCKRQLIDVSLSHRCVSPSLSSSLPLSLRINK
ncbi:hypothetical protein HJG60_011016 [Phyllostomus discolor]|uniref:Uncharacterized protein n=1 Tax=Phyllostomus discolor TaxID=89673 RepID=A0A834E6P4_9CHIR|nr:hypothetical protein HJG60_011016 [Phyllostomus discolor]